MRKTLLIARRELAGFFLSPMAYVIGAMFLAACGLKFAAFPGSVREWFILVPGREASLRSLFEMMAMAMIIAAPVLTMRLVSEELRSGTIETLMTAAVTDSQVILGKFLGVMGFFLTLLMGTGVFVVIMAFLSQPDWGVVLMGYAGIILLAMSFFAVGLFASALTRYQIVAAVAATAILGTFGLLIPQLIPLTSASTARLVGALSVMTYFEDFARGIFDTRGLVFFLSTTAIFLFMSIKILESKRWR